MTRRPRGEEWLRGFERRYAEAGLLGAFRYWARLDTERAKTQYVPPALLAALYAAIGDVDASFEWLERAYEERPVLLAANMLGNPNFDGIREDPRFQAILEGMGMAD